MDPTLEEVLEVVGVSIGGVAIATVVSCSCFVGGLVATQACFRGVRAGRGMLRMLRVRSLGGVTRLEHPMGRDCAMCQYPMDGGEEIHTLSCGHVFHATCELRLNNWLRDHDLRCPFCCQIARCVRVMPWPWPWNAQTPEEDEAEAEAEASQSQVELAPEANFPQSQEGSSSSTHVVIDMEAPATSSAQRPEEQHPTPASSLEEPLLRPSASP